MNEDISKAAIRVDILREDPSMMSGLFGRLDPEGDPAHDKSRR